jgi:hypothetical protein
MIRGLEVNIQAHVTKDDGGQSQYNDGKEV